MNEISLHLVYWNYNLLPFTNANIPVVNYNTTFKLKNHFNREATHKPKLKSDFYQINSIDSFHKDIKDFSNIKQGKVDYYMNQYGGEYSFSNLEFSDGCELYDHTNIISYDIFSQEKTIYNHLLSKCVVLSISHEVDIDVSPQQCYIANMQVKFLKAVPIPYKANVTLSAKNNLNETIMDLPLLNLAKQIVADGRVVDLQDRETITFQIDGFLRHDALIGVETSVIDLC